MTWPPRTVVTVYSSVGGDQPFLAEQITSAGCVARGAWPLRVGDDVAITFHQPDADGPTMTMTALARVARDHSPAADGGHLYRLRFLGWK